MEQKRSESGLRVYKKAVMDLQEVCCLEHTFTVVLEAVLSQPRTLEFRVFHF